jgi:hypothetical protein
MLGRNIDEVGGEKGSMLSNIAVDSPKRVLFQLIDADSIDHQMWKPCIVWVLLSLLPMSQEMKVLDADLLQKRQQLIVIERHLLYPMAIITDTEPPAPFHNHLANLPFGIRLSQPLPQR